MVEVHISIDVPELEAGLGFYRSVFGWRETARPFPTMAVLDAGNVRVCVHEKPDGSPPAPGASERSYRRHWTPVHLDLHVDDVEQTVARAVEAGATVEQRFTGGPHPDVAFCADPFGNGFCVIGPRGAG